jgi:hypothetical protein
MATIGWRNIEPGGNLHDHLPLEQLLDEAVRAAESMWGRLSNLRPIVNRPLILTRDSVQTVFLQYHSTPNPILIVSVILGGLLRA